MPNDQKNIDVEESNAFVETFSLRAEGSGPLSDLSFAVKDLIDVRGYTTGCGNPDWRNTHPPAASNAVCVDQLLSAGADCLGKTITDELAFGLTGENFFYGTPLNPRAPDRVPGGSSCGSASAVACGIVDFALGTDTGGSVRVPASNCGIYGIRPSHGIISVAGVNPFAPTFDTVGVLAGTWNVFEKASSVLIGCDIPENIEIGTIHLVKESFEISDPVVKAAMAEPLRGLNEGFPGKVKRTSLRTVVGEKHEKDLNSWYQIYRVVQSAETWSCLGSWIEQTKPEFGPRPTVSFKYVKNMDRNEIGPFVRKRESYYLALKDFLGPNDLLCMPTTPAIAPEKGTLGIDRTKGDYYPRTLSLTAVSGVGRMPQVTLPLAEVNGVPIGLSLLASQGRDAFLLAACRMIAK
jgi:amidase